MRYLWPLCVLALAGCATSSMSDLPAGQAAFSLLANPHADVSVVERYALRLSPAQAIKADGAQAAGFAQGYPFAPGSGLALKSIEKDGSLVFWGLGDRGPNGDSPKLRKAGKLVESKVFAAPDFVPRFAQIHVSLASEARVVAEQALKMPGGKAASGLPLPPGQTGATGELPLSAQLAELPYSAEGVDPEGITQDAAGNLWIVDEYGPFLMKVEAKSGQVLEKYAPGMGLPAELAHRQPNRGFEGVAVTPAGKIYAAVQSTLDIEGKTKNQSEFIRLVEFDPASKATRQFAYRLDVADYKKNGDAKLGDLVAIDNSRFLLVEQGKGKNGMRNVLYIIDIAGAQDISTYKTAGGQALEFASSQEMAAIRAVKKQRVFDLRDLGWKTEKVEGLALVNGGIAVINDNDFGLSTRIAGDKGDDLGAYVLENGKLTPQGKYSLHPNHEDTELWLLHLSKPLSAWYPK